jgi:hypothetical protein
MMHDVSSPRPASFKDCEIRVTSIEGLNFEKLVKQQIYYEEMKKLGTREKWCPQTRHAGSAAGQRPSEPHR